MATAVTYQERLQRLNEADPEVGQKFIDLVLVINKLDTGGQSILSLLLDDVLSIFDSPPALQSKQLDALKIAALAARLRQNNKP
jgi:hypothetical protein